MDTDLMILSDLNDNALIRLVQNRDETAFHLAAHSSSVEAGE